MATVRYERKDYIVRETSCKKKDCFLPFTGNGIPICRLYEMGQCPINEREK